eukprot:COSAG02_NODE_1177_length_14052_cov_5.923171_8_plen_78_part_00
MAEGSGCNLGTPTHGLGVTDHVTHATKPPHLDCCVTHGPRRPLRRGAIVFSTVEQVPRHAVNANQFSMAVRAHQHMA